MAAEFIILLGDTPHEITSGNPYQKFFKFEESLPPNDKKPSMLMLNVQALNEPTNVQLNNAVIGQLTPTINFSINNTLTSPTYNDGYFNYFYNPSNQPLYVKDFLSDIQFTTTTITDDYYWATQMINLGAKDSGGEESGESVLFPWNPYMDNLLTIESVSQSFRIKDIILHYHVKSA